MNWITQRQDGDVEGSTLGTEEEIRRNTKEATSDLWCHNHSSCEQSLSNSSYTLRFWSNYIHSVKRHHIMRSTNITEADRRVSKMSDCTRNRPENSADFIMIRYKSKIYSPLQH